jgi:integrase
MAVKQDGRGGWMYDVRHPITHRRKRVGGFRTRAQANEALAVLRAGWIGQQHGVSVDLDRVRLNMREELLREVEILGSRQFDIFERSEYMQGRVARRYAAILPAGLAVTSLRSEHFDLIIQSELKRGIKPQSVGAYLVKFRAVLRRVKARNRALLANWTIPPIPEGAVPGHKSRVLTRRPWTNEEFESVLDVLRHPERIERNVNRLTRANCRDAADVLLIAAMTGMRKTEILMLQWHEVRFDLGIILARTLKKKGGEKFKVREVPMADEVSDVFLQRKNDGGDDPLVFPRWRSNPQGCWIRRSIQKAARVAGINYGDSDFGVVLHGLRHTAATKMLAGGVDIKTAADILGNTATVMLETYAHTTIESKRRAIGALKYGRSERKAA